VSSIECPKSLISPRSLQFLEQYAAWKQFGGINVLDLDAKTADAFSVLERAWQEETKNGEVEK
jgi:hypothetical protein